MEAISKALVAFQAECKNVAPNQTAGKGGKFTYEYADLPTVLAELKPRLKKHGLAIVQSPIAQGTLAGVRTLIVHESGEQIDLGGVMLPNTEGTAQGAGKCVTYARRYSISALALICTEKDCDAQMPAPRQTPLAEEYPTREPAAPTPDEPEWLGLPMIGKKYKGRPWRYMTQGSVGGERQQYLEYMEGWLADKIAEDPQGKWSDKNREDMARITACIDMIGKGEEPPPMGDDEVPF